VGFSVVMFNMAFEQRASIAAALGEVYRRSETRAKVGRWEMGILGEVEREGELERILRREPALADFSGGFMRSDGTGSSVLSMTNLIAWLVERTFKVGVEQTIADLERYVESPTFPYRFLIGVRGIAIGELCELADGISALPPVQEIRRFETNEPQPTSAVLELLENLPKVVSSAGSFSVRLDAAADVADGAFDRLNLARVCIALAIDSPVVQTTRTAIPAESVPPTGGTGASTALGTMGVSVHQADGQLLTLARQVHERFVALPSILRDRLAIAAHRWHGSIMRGPTPDLFIDVGIGLECVYLSDGAGELKHRMMIRAGRLLASSTAERIQVARVIDALYEARSQAVHTGRMPSKIRNRVAIDIYELARMGQQILRRSILALMARGRDDWDELIFE